MATTKKKRRIRSPHPGVVLVAPHGAFASWRAKYKSPDSGKVVWERIDPKYSTHEARRDWAIDKSKALAARRTALAAGAPRATGTTLDDAIDRYFRGNPQLAPRYRDDLRKATDKFRAWAARVGLKSGDDLTLPRLISYREQVIAAPRQRQAPGRKRGAREATDKLRTASAVNGDLRRLRVVLSYMRKAGLLPKLTDDDLSDGLELLEAPTERIEFLQAHQVQALLKAAREHDLATFTETRDEHKGDGRKRIGTTHRYDPIFGFVVFVLLTGMRLHEVLEVTWGQVDLAAKNHKGTAVGEIHIRGRDAKTGKARTVSFDVSPSLKPLLESIPGEKRSDELVWAGYTEALVNAAAKRLRADYRAPYFTWQMLRRTCGTFLTNAPGIYGGASAYQSAKRLGHSVEVAEKHYVGVVRGISPTARTLEAALGIEAIIRKVTCG